MANSALSAFIEKVTFFDGQRLFAADLQELEDYNQQLRWLHNQSLHQWGVASGYAVAGNKGDGQVSIQPGYALDVRGREIVLTTPQTQPIPPIADDGNGQPVGYDLTVSYSLQPSETRQGVCDSQQGAVRLLDEPAFCWLRSDSPLVEDGLHIRLAQVEIFNCKLNKSISIAQRQNAKPSSQPYVAAGSTAPTNAKWQPAQASDSGVTISQTVDTSSAAFRVAPVYFAEIRGDRNVTVSVNGVNTPLLLDGFVRVDNPKQISFDLTLLIPAVLFGSLKPPDVALKLADALSNWYIDWIGVEA